MNLDESYKHPAKWWHKEKVRFRCELCPRRCLMRSGQSGFCFVRQAFDDGIYLIAYGKSSGFCVDPIEKKPLYHFLPGSSVFSFGTIGCNLACQFCQNWDISKSKQNLLVQATPEEIAQTAQEQSSQSVAFTYNDPVIFVEYALDTAKECKKRGIKTVAVTAGYISETAREEFFSSMDAVNIDLKFFTKESYAKYSGVQIDHILDNLKYVAQLKNTWLEITTLLIPGINDSSEEVRRMCQWMRDNLGVKIPIHFTAFHPDFKLRDRPKTPLSTLKMARAIALEEGHQYVYTGNVQDPEGSSTLCPQCKSILIVRRGLFMVENHLKNNSCPNCNADIDGVFS